MKSWLVFPNTLTYYTHIFFPSPHTQKTQETHTVFYLFLSFLLSHKHLSNVTGLNTGRSVMYFYHILARNHGSCLQLYGHRTHTLYPHTQAHAHTHTYIYHHKVNTGRTVVYTVVASVYGHNNYKQRREKFTAR